MSLSTYWDALLLQYGTVGLYGLFQRLFIIYGILALSGSLLIDAPFGRFGWEKSSEGGAASKGIGRWWNELKHLTVPGDIGWLIMEIVSPLTFLLSFSLPISPSPITAKTILTSLSSLPQTLLSLPHSAQILISLYLIHYLNRSILSSLYFNPGRARMHIMVPSAAVVFNILNGFLLGSYLSGGASASGKMGSEGWGIKEGRIWLFTLGILLFMSGFLGNIYSDEILYRLKRTSTSSATPSKPTSKSAKKPTTSTPKHTRYSIPHSFLYSHPFGGISHPAYFTEWIEWTGFLLATLSLTSANSWPEGADEVWSVIPSLLSTSIGVGEGLQGVGGWKERFVGGLKNLLVANLKGLGGTDGTLVLGGEALGAGGGGGGKVLKYLNEVPESLWPLKGWWLQPPALFLWNEIAAMLPRAISGHEWYKKTFGDEFPRERKRVIPGVF